MEVWRDIKGYENKYMVSSQGNVKSLNYNNTGKERLLKQKINKYGFCEVKLSKNNKTKDFMVARLVAEAFLPNPSNKPFVKHINRDGQDNSVKNLIWTYSRVVIIDGIEYDGEFYKNISQLAKAKGIEPKAVFKRLKRNWTLEEALEIPLQRENKILNVTLYDYYGKLMSVKQLSEISGISKKNIYKRLSRKWNIYECVEIPLSKKKKGGSNVNAKS